MTPVNRPIARDKSPDRGVTVGRTNDPNEPIFRWARQVGTGSHCDGLDRVSMPRRGHPMRRIAGRSGKTLMAFFRNAIDAGSLVHTDRWLVTRPETFRLHALSTWVRRVATPIESERPAAASRPPFFLFPRTVDRDEPARYCGGVDCAGSPRVMVCVSSPHVVLAGLLKSSPL